MNDDLDLAGAEEAWRLYLADKAALTQENYGRDLQAFAEYVGHGDGMVALAWLFTLDAVAGNKTIHGYHAHLVTVRIGEGPDQQIGYADATVRRRIYALRAIVGRAKLYNIVNWEIDLELPSAEPARRTRGPGPDGYAAVLDALEKAIQEARDSEDRLRQLEIALRDRVLVRLLHDSALRRTETTGIEWPLGVRLGNEPSVLVLGKGKRRQQWVPISTTCAAQIKAYLDVRGRRAGYLITGTGSRAAARMSKSTVNRRIAHWADVAGVPFTPHGLRHTAITTALDASDGNRRVVRQFSRHKSEASLGPYDDARLQHDRRLAELVSDPSDAEPHS
jgi:integrase/recombinase XerC